MWLAVVDTVKVDLVTLDPATGLSAAYEIKRGHGRPDAGKRQMIIDDLIRVRLVPAGALRADGYRERGAIVFHDTAEEARAALVADRFAATDAGVTAQAVYAFTNAEIDDLNRSIRAEPRRRGTVGPDELVIAGAGYGVGDRIRFAADRPAGARPARQADRQAPCLGRSHAPAVRNDRDAAAEPAIPVRRRPGRSPRRRPPGFGRRGRRKASARRRQARTDPKRGRGGDRGRRRAW